MRLTFTRPLLAILLTVLTLRCNDETTLSSGTTSAPLSVAVIPSTVSLLAGGVQDFTTTVTNDAGGRGVTWAITGCNGGAVACGSLSNITSTGATYTAPATVLPGTLGITATSVSDNTKAFTATVTVIANGAGGELAFVSHRDGNSEIYTMNADGSGQVNLTNNPAFDDTPVWSPDGSKLAFRSGRDGNLGIYVMNADGSGVVRLTNDTAADGDPDWSPDGSKIAFVSDRDGTPEIYVMNTDGSGVVRLTTDNLNAVPVWSPDGSKIAFTSRRDGNPEIYVMNADGSGQVNLTNNPAADLTPAWSPDGSKIAFSSYRDGKWVIFVMNADGSGVTQLSNHFDLGGGPAWSPDGTRIVFYGMRMIIPSVGAAFPLSDIYVVGANGSGLRNLTNNANDSSHPVVSAPAWSPGGAEIAFLLRDNSGHLGPAINLMSADGSRQVRLIATSDFSWKPR